MKVIWQKFWENFFFFFLAFQKCPKEDIGLEYGKKMKGKGREVN